MWEKMLPLSSSHGNMLVQAKDRKTQGWKQQDERDANRNVVDSDL